MQIRIIMTQRNVKYIILFTEEQNKYKNTVIYKIYCKDANINDFYIGHTTNSTKRKHQHKGHCYHEN